MKHVVVKLTVPAEKMGRVLGKRMVNRDRLEKD